jgi:hypothetical protein
LNLFSWKTPSSSASLEIYIFSNCTWANLLT